MRAASLLALLALTACAPRWRPVGEFTPRRALSAGARRELAARAALGYERPRSAESVSGSLVDYQRLIAADQTRVDYLLGAARAAAWLAGHDADADERVRRARLGVEYSAEALRLEETSAEAHLLRAVCLGYYSREKHGGALGHVEQMARHARRVVALDPRFEQAGGHRFLCRLLAQAPEVPTSIGDPEAAVEQGLAATRLAPAHPENWLALAAAYAADDRPEEARAAARRTLALLGRGDWEDAGAWRAEATKLLKR